MPFRFEFVWANCYNFTGKGVNIILDCIGGRIWEQNVSCLATDGRWVLYGTMGGRAVDGNLLGKLLSKRGHLLSSLLRSRSLQVRWNMSLDLYVFCTFSSGAVPDGSPFSFHSTKQNWWRHSRTGSYHISQGLWDQWLTAHSTWRTLQRLTGTWKPIETQERLSLMWYLRIWKFNDEYFNQIPSHLNVLYFLKCIFLTA